MTPQRLVDPSHTLSPTAPPQTWPLAFDALTIILACRSRARALDARDRLLIELDSELLRRRLRSRGNADAEKMTAYADDFRKNLALDFVPCDLASTSSVLKFCDAVKQT